MLLRRKSIDPGSYLLVRLGIARVSRGAPLAVAVTMRVGRVRRHFGRIAVWRGGKAKRVLGLLREYVEWVN